VALGYTMFYMHKQAASQHSD